MNDSIYSFIRSTTFRLMSLSFIFIYSLLVLTYQHHIFIAADEKITLKQVLPKIKNLASNVSVGLHISNFSTFSFNERQFLIDAIVWFKFPSGTIAIKTLERFTIQSAFMQENGDLLFRSKPSIQLAGDDVIVSYYVQTVFTTLVNFKYFPMGGHTLNIVIQNRDVTPEQVCFNTQEDTLTLEKKTFFAWNVTSTKTDAGYIESALNTKNTDLKTTYPAAVFSIAFETPNKNNLFSLFLPLFLIFLLLLFSFFYDIAASERIATVTAIVPSLILFKLVINSMAPQTAFTTHIDYFFYGLALLSLFVLFFQMFVALSIQKNKDESELRLKEVKHYLAAYNDIFFVACFCILFLLITGSFWR